MHSYSLPGQGVFCLIETAVEFHSIEKIHIMWNTLSGCVNEFKQVNLEVFLIEGFEELRFP